MQQNYSALVAGARRFRKHYTNEGYANYFFRLAAQYVDLHRWAYA
jgi:hypothetical protein